MSERRQSSVRFPLLVYRRIYHMWFWPSMLLTIASIAMVVWRPVVLRGREWAFVPAALVAFGLATYAVLARTAAYVQPHPRHLRIRAPFYRLAVSYGRVHVVRTTQFKRLYPPESLSWSQRRLAQGLYGQTCILVALKGYPVSRRWLAFFLGCFLLPPHEEGLVFLVEDWLGLSHAVEGARADWINRRAAKREARTVARVLGE